MSFSHLLVWALNLQPFSQRIIIYRQPHYSWSDSSQQPTGEAYTMYLLPLSDETTRNKFGVNDASAVFLLVEILARAFGLAEAPVSAFS